MASIDEGQPPKRIPDELKGWNWGAFLLNWVWGIGNNTYIALLTLVPFVGLLIMPFVLGAKGNEWAWRNGRWDSIEHFRRVQQRWAVWGLVIPIAMVCLFGAIFGGVFYALKTSEAYRMGVAQLQQNRAAADLLGPPIATGFPIGSINVSGQSGGAVLDFSATGSKASGRIVLRATKKDGIWLLTDMRLLVDGRNEAIDLLKEDHASSSLRKLIVTHSAASKSSVGSVHNSKACISDGCFPLYL